MSVSPRWSWKNARKVENWIRDCGGIGFEGLQNKQESFLQINVALWKRKLEDTLLISANQGCETRNFLQTWMFVQSTEL